MARKQTTKHIATDEHIEAIQQYSRAADIPQWKIAALVSLHPSVLSRVMNKKNLYEPEIPKIKSITQHIGFKGECFKSIETPA
jgi:hypothetical protein